VMAELVADLYRDGLIKHNRVLVLADKREAPPTCVLMRTACATTYSRAENIAGIRLLSRKSMLAVTQLICLPGLRRAGGHSLARAV
jgi:hypothetical protein